MDKKNIWIMNHYATNMYFNKGGRHYWFGQCLKKKGYEPVIFCANTRHNRQDRVEVQQGKYTTMDSEGVPYNFVKTNDYTGNGLSRIKNMFGFYKNLFSATQDYGKTHGKPDVILASSVHPLTLVAGLKIAKKFGVPCICEVRDLWPESLVAYGALKPKGFITKILYRGEKWIYKKADGIIMTWEGGKQYIMEQGWDKDLDIQKVKHISNGVVLDSFDENSEAYVVEDEDLKDDRYKNIIYAGSIRKVNNLGLLLDAAKKIQEDGHREIRFLVYGAGDQKDGLEQRCREEEIQNVRFKGFVEKKYVPSILKKSYVNILHNSSTSLDRYGQSQNKFFEYLAAGRCIVQTYTTGYSICEKYQCGLSAGVQNAEEIAKVIVEACSDEEKNRIMGENARKAANDFDFNRLTDKLITVVEELQQKN